MKSKSSKSKTNIAEEPRSAYLADGQPVLLDTSARSDTEKGQLARSGLTKQFALEIQHYLGLTGEEMSALLPISYRSYQRKKENDKLDRATSQQLIALAEILDHAKDVFSDPQDQVGWFFEPLMGLGLQRPIDLLDNSFHQRLVHQALGRLKHGIFA